MQDFAILIILFVSLLLLVGFFLYAVPEMSKRMEERKAAKAHSAKMAERRAEVLAKGITYGDKW